MSAKVKWSTRSLATIADEHLVEGPATDDWTPLDADLVSRSHMVETHGGGGIERVPGFAPRRAMTAGLPGGRPVPSDAMRPEAVFGGDERVEIPETSTLPWRSICHLLIQRQNGSTSYGTGWLAGPRLVVTAGHCVVDHARGGWASRMTVVPGSNGSYPPPFGAVDATDVEAHPLWEKNANAQYDYGFVTLPDERIGRTLGWFGFAVVDDARLSRMIVNVAGYPVDKPSGTMWFNSGRILGTDPHFLRYMLDTEAGQSGAPVFWYGQEQQRIAVGIHAYHEGSSNKARRITTDVHQRIVQLRGF